MIILGVNAFHGDSSACILKDGEVLVAIEEERIRRVKHWAGFPIEAIKYCLEDTGIKIEDVDFVAISRDPSANVLQKVKHILKNKISPKVILDRLANRKKVSSALDILASEMKVDRSRIKAKQVNVEHHRSHLASAFFVSPFKKAALLSIDGFGDFTSTMTATGEGESITVLDKVIYPHSLGIFYTSFTQFLGFPHYGDEYKVMGLAPYGKPVYVEKLREVINFLDNGLFSLNLDYFTHHNKGVQMSWEGGAPFIDSIFSEKFAELLGPARKKEDELTDHHRNIASSVQRITEECIFHILNHLHKKTGLDELCIAGGVAQNSVANGKILKNTPFKKVYIPPAGHDAGTCAGAALYAYHQLEGKPRVKQMRTGSLGSHYSNDFIRKFLADKNVNYKELDRKELYDKVTDSIIDGGVIGWFQGRAEFGPRALGHRSILADPRRTDAKDLLNSKIKRRESFRPFAPSILKDYKDEYFEFSDDVPFMEKVYVIKEEKRSSIPAVTHVDGTGRLQTVDKEVEPVYHGLIKTFYDKTGVPVLLNTSFNENEPIVNTPAEALDCFLRTKMDVLVLENFFITRK